MDTPGRTPQIMPRSASDDSHANSRVRIVAAGNGPQPAGPTNDPGRIDGPPSRPAS
jgi:hypothetical protein